MGRTSITASMRQTKPSACSIGGNASPLSLGFSSFSARSNHGSTRPISTSKSARAMDRLAMKSGSQALRPSSNCAERNSSGTPSTVERPGGLGMALGTANTNSRAANARSPSAAKDPAPRRVPGPGPQPVAAGRPRAQPPDRDVLEVGSSHARVMRTSSMRRSDISRASKR